ncbi:MAG: MFS transporter, partial [Bacteroidales bacterium]|nr:MFS transporter [Bacteroidales bacterium]
LMVNKFGVSEEWAGWIPSIVPFGTIFLTPLFGSIYDRKGKGATIMILGAVLLIIVHVVYYLPGLTSVYLAFANAILLGIGFSLVPSAMWPSVPKIIPEKQLGSAYAFIFWIQNFGLWGIPLLIGVVLERTNPGVSEAMKAGEDVTYNYETTWLIFVGLTILALFVAFWLKAEDKRKGYGLELPNIQK